MITIGRNRMPVGLVLINAGEAIACIARRLFPMNNRVRAGVFYALPSLVMIASLIAVKAGDSGIPENLKQQANVTDRRDPLPAGGYDDAAWEENGTWKFQSGAQSAGSATGILYITKTGGHAVTCTGVAIAKDAVLTAKHCLGDASKIHFVQDVYQRSDLSSLRSRGVELNASPVRWRTKTRAPTRGAVAPCAKQQSDVDDSGGDNLDFAILNTKVPLARNQPSNTLIASKFKIGGSDRSARIDIIQHPKTWHKLRPLVCQMAPNCCSDPAFVRHICYTDRGSSGALVLAYQDDRGLLPSALHTGIDPLADPDGRPLIKIATSLSHLKDRVSDPMHPLYGAALLRDLDLWWTRNWNNTRENAPTLSRLADFGETCSLQSAGGVVSSFTNLSSTQASKESGLEPPPADDQDESDVGYSPQTNAKFDPVSGQGAPSTKGVSDQLKLIGFQVLGSTTETMSRLASGVPKKFQGPLETSARTVWVSNTTRLKKADGLWHMGPDALSREDTRWSKREQVLANGVQYVLDQHNMWVGPQGECEIREGYQYTVGGYYEPLETFSGVTRANWGVRGRLSGAACGVFRNTPPGSSIPDTAAITKLDISKITPSGSVIEGGYERNVVWNLEIPQDNGLIPRPCNQVGSPECGTLLRYHQIEEKLVLKRGKTDLWPIRRKAVVDAISSVRITDTEAVVRVSRCKFNSGPDTLWPDIERVHKGDCPEGMEPKVFFLQYRDNAGLVCRLDIESLGESGRGLTRTRSARASSPDCLAEFEPGPRVGRDQILVPFSLNKCNLSAEANRKLEDAVAEASVAGSASMYAFVLGKNFLNEDTERLQECRARAIRSNLIAKGVPETAILLPGDGIVGLVMNEVKR